MVMAKRKLDDLLDEKGATKRPFLVKLRRTFFHARTLYEPARFGVLIPAGVKLPRDAEILGEPEVPAAPVAAEDTQSSLNL